MLPSSLQLHLLLVLLAVLGALLSLAPPQHHPSGLRLARTEGCWLLGTLGMAHRPSWAAAEFLTLGDSFQQHSKGT